MRLSIASTAIAAATLALFFCINDADARKIRTSHKLSAQSSTQRKADSDVFSGDGMTVFTPDSTVWPGIAEKIRFYGYDKSANSNVESFFVTNRTDSTLRAVGLDIVYLDMKGRQLHRRHIDITCNVAPGETMRHDIKSWDTQKSFYFHQSAKPRRQATPFDVRIELKAASLGH